MSLSIGVAFDAQRKRVDSVLLLGDINPGLGSVEPEDTNGGALAMCLHEWDGTVEGHGAVHLVFEDVGVVQPVGLGIGIIAAPTITLVAFFRDPKTGNPPGSLQRKSGSMLRDTKDVGVAGERDVK